MNKSELRLGANPLGNNQTRFCVWAPRAKTAEVHVLSAVDAYFPLQPDDQGYFTGIISDLPAGTRYVYRLDKRMERPDPASAHQPEGVHGPSDIIDDAFDWTDRKWTGRPLQEYIFYELHVGTFTGEGTFEAVIPKLDDLVDLGITAIELMPVAQFPGTRNWGYDGVFPFAVQNSYGGPEGLKRLVDACHRRGLAVVLDVVYNHLGPEGNYLNDFGFYFSERYQTPWGAPINFDGPFSDEVRRYFIENAVSWFTRFHLDALRLDAVHAILDFSATPFLQELADTTGKLSRELGQEMYLFPESALNDSRLLRSPAVGGYGLDAQWNDDFHHALHTVLTGENTGYYMDFGQIDQLGKALTHGFVYDGIYSRYRKRRHGNSAQTLPPEKMVVFSQNHDQVGNRMNGDRLTTLLPETAVRLAAAMVILSPYLPLLFMGEEYGETAPFPYFISHSDTDLIEAVRKGRTEEFASFGWTGTPPDPQAPSTFHSAKLARETRLSSESHRHMLEYYKRLIQLRKEIFLTERWDKKKMKVSVLSQQPVICVGYPRKDAGIFMVFYFSDRKITHSIPLPKGIWQKIHDSAESGPPTGHTPNPPRIESKGSVDLELDAHACRVFRKIRVTKS